MGIAIPINLGAAVTPEGRLKVSGNGGGGGGGGQSPITLNILFASERRDSRGSTDFDPFFCLNPSYTPMPGFIKVNDQEFSYSASCPIKLMPFGVAVSLAPGTSKVTIIVNPDGNQALPGVYFNNTVFNLSIAPDGEITSDVPGQSLQIQGNTVVLLGRSSFTCITDISREIFDTLQFSLEYWDPVQSMLVSSGVNPLFAELWYQGNIIYDPATRGSMFLIDPTKIEDLGAPPLSELFLKIVVPYAEDPLFVPFWLNITAANSKRGLPLDKVIKSFGGIQLDNPEYFTAEGEPSISLATDPSESGGQLTSVLSFMQISSLPFTLNGGTGYAHQQVIPYYNPTPVSYPPETSLSIPNPGGKLVIDSIGTSQSSPSVIEGKLVLIFDPIFGVSVDASETTMSSANYQLNTSDKLHPSLSFTS